MDTNGINMDTLDDQNKDSIYIWRRSNKKCNLSWRRSEWGMIESLG